MVNQTVTVFPPNGPAAVFVGWTLVGTADQGLAVNDASDATYLDDSPTPGIRSYAVYDVANPVIPAGAKIYAARSLVRASETANLPFAAPANQLSIGMSTTDGQYFDNINAHPATPTTYSFGWQTRTPGGAEWTQATLDALQLVLSVYQQAAVLAWRAYRAYFDIQFNEKPAVVVTGPAEAGTITNTTRPTVTWTFTDVENDPQEAFQVKVFTLAQYSAGGFDPTTSTAAYDSGKVYSNATTHTITADLANGTHRAYVRAWQPWAASEHVSDWDSNTFSVAVDPPSPPNPISAVADPTSALGPRVAVSLRGTDNLLSENQASFEVSATLLWAAGANTNAPTRAVSVPAPVHGSWAMQFTSIAAGNISVFTNPRLTIVGGQQYTAIAHLASFAVTSRTAFVQIDWYDASAVFISSSVGNTVATTNAGWRMSSVTANAPANAATAAVVIWVQATGGAGEVHYADKVSLSQNVPLGGNLLPANQASMETDASNWSVGASTALARITSLAYLGAAALQLTNSSGGVSDISVFAVPRAAVNAYVSYQLSAWFRSAVTPRQVRVEITWTTLVSGGTTISTSTGTAVLTNTGGWVQATVLAVAPATALGAAMTLRVIGTSPGEVHYIDQVALQPVTWSPGGLTVTYLLEYSDDAGVTWTTHPRATAVGSDALAVIYDYEVPDGVTRRWRAKSRATVGGLTLTSDPSVATVYALMDWTSGWWLKDPLDPTRNLRLRLTETGFTSQAEEPQGIFWGLSRATPVVVSDTPRSESFELGLSFLDDAEYARFETLRASQRTLLLQSDWGEQWWVRLGGTRQASVLRAVAPRSSLPRTVTVPAVEVAALT